MGIEQVLAPDRHTREISDGSLLTPFKTEVPADEWDAASIEAGRASGMPVIASMDGSEIAALASYEPIEGLESLGGLGANPGILVRPRHRGQGHGRSVLAAITKRIVHDGRLPVLQTLEANAAMVRCAEAIGYTVHARHLALRFVNG